MKREQPDSKLHIAHDDETEKLRDWWKRNGTGIIAGVLIGIGSVGGIQGWRMYQDSQGEKASALYERMLGAAANQETDVCGFGCFNAGELITATVGMPILRD